MNAEHVPMRVAPYQARPRPVAPIALGAASEHGFALGGGNALIAHGVIDRTTQDVDLCGRTAGVGCG
jgi:hypothetical protein